MLDAAPPTPRLARRSGRLLAVSAAVVTFAAVPALATVPLLGPAPASAASSGTSIDATLRFLQDAQRADGGFADESGQSSPTVSTWAALGLASAGINPRDQKSQRVSNDVALSAWTYLVAAAPGLGDTGDAARLLLVARAAGEKGRSVNGIDLVALLQQRQQADGSFVAASGAVQVDATAFAILALSTTSGDDASAAAARGADWLESIHGLGRGWGQTVGGPDRVDVTGLVLQALSAVGRTKAAKDAANNGFLSENLDASGSGGFPLQRGGKVDPVATAWAIQGLRAAGIDPSAWGPDALTYLRDVRRSSDGSIEGSVLRTAQVTGALNRRLLVLAAVPRGAATPPKTEKKEPRKEPERDRPTSSGSTGTGSGSTGSGSGDGVTTGGGGSGASVYQGAQSGSAGSTAGAAVSTTPTGAASGARGTGGSKTSEQTTAPTPKQKKQEQPTTTGGGGPEVSGTVVSGTQDKEDAAAAGLRSAGAGDGDGDPWVTRGLGGALLLVAGLGAVIEGRRPRRRVFSITEVEGPLLDAPPARRGWLRAGTDGSSGFRGRFRRADRGVISDATPSDDAVAASTATTTPVQL